MNLLGKNFKSAIFDMDGTLIDSTGLWHEIDINFFAKRGMELPEGYTQHIVHLGLKEAARYTKKTYHLEESEKDIMNEWYQMSVDMYRYNVPLKEGALELLELLKKNNIKMAIATANDEELYKPCIERLDIAKYFDFIADVDNAKEGKQSAKIYLDLAEKLDSEPQETLVFEDMPVCVKTAFNSGFITISVFDNSSKNYEDVKRNNSHLYINSFNEIIKLLK